VTADKAGEELRVQKPKTELSINRIKAIISPVVSSTKERVIIERSSLNEITEKNPVIIRKIPLS
jgi:hypothetical protein